MDRTRDPELRYSRCMPALSQEELSVLRTKKAAVVGCGGLGGYILEMLARAGIGAVSFADPDVFEPTNLNRQILATESTIGREKVREAQRRLLDIRPDIRLFGYQAEFSEETAAAILKLLARDTTEEQIVEELLKEYTGDKAEIAAYVHEFIEKLKAEGIVE